MVLNATSVASRYGTTGLPLTDLVLPVANRPTRLLTRGSHTWVVDAGGAVGVPFVCVCGDHECPRPYPNVRCVGAGFGDRHGHAGGGAWGHQPVS